MTFDEVWEKVQGLPDAAKLQVPLVLSRFTKERLANYSPEEISRIVISVIEEVNHGSIEPLDALIQKKI